MGVNQSNMTNLRTNMKNVKDFANAWYRGTFIWKLWYLILQNHCHGYYVGLEE